MALPAIPIDELESFAKSKENDFNRLFLDPGLSPGQMGKADSLKHNVLSAVINEEYEKALHLLEQFQKSQSEFQNFHQKTDRFISHSSDLVKAIRTKRSFPGLNQLTRAKQQELRDKFKEHFNELQYALGKVEKIYSDLKISDARSTVWVVRTFFYSVLICFSVWTATLLVGGVGQSISILVDSAIDKAISLIF